MTTECRFTGDFRGDECQPRKGEHRTGIAIGVLGDILLSPTFRPSYVLWGIVLSPFTVTAGGRAVTIDALDSMFLVGGILFWPGYLVLSALWLRSRKSLS